MTIRNLYPDIRPSLNLDFANSKRLDSRITFTRASTGTYTDESGIIRTAAANEARFDHDGDGNSLGLLIEESRTNLVTYSEDLTDGSWVKGSSTVAGNAISAPDGTVTADKLVETANGPTSHVVSKATTTTAGSHTFSVYLKKAERSFALLYDLTNSVGAYFNLDTGAITTGGSGIPAASAYSSQYAGNGWWRCSITQSASAGTTTYRVYLAESGTVYSYTGNGTSGIYVWGAQVEAGAFPTSYIPTSGSTVTRSADVASITGTNFSSWYNQSQGSWFVDSKCPVSPNNQWVFALNPSGTGEDMVYRGDTNTLRSLARYRGDVFDTNDAPPGQFNKASLGYQLTSQASSYFNTVSGIYSSIAGNTGTPTSLVFGLTPGNTVLNGTISRLTYYPVRLPDATLQALTL
jgi:hypothetical protein